jgi:hypothetical protein
MPFLTAIFKLNVSAPCLIEWPLLQKKPEFKISLGDFTVVAFLIPGLLRGAGNNCVLGTLKELVIAVSRNELDSPPDESPSDHSNRRLLFFFDKEKEYSSKAREVSNQILLFFQYPLSTPLIHAISIWDVGLQDPKWYDEVGTQLHPGGSRFKSTLAPPGDRGELGVKKLTPNNMSELVEFIETSHEISLADTLLSDAQSAWFEDNLRRSVLELAICTEVMVKRCFFAQDSPAGAAFDYLEDKAKVSVRVIDLLDKVAEAAFSVSYKKDEPNNFQNIDYLFRCRNKIAHRGELSFSDDSGNSVSVDKSKVEEWWNSVSHLKSWLKEL